MKKLNSILQTAALSIAVLCGLMSAALVVGGLMAPTFVGFAIAQEAPGVVEGRPLADALMPYIVDLALVGFLALATWVAAFIKQKTGIDIESGLKNIEARHREAMHSAIYSAVAALRAKSGVDKLTFNVGSEEVASILRSLRDSVPEALEYFAPPSEVIAKIAAAKALEVDAKAAAAAPAR